MINAYTDGSLRRTKQGIICGYGIYFPNNELPNVSKKFTLEPITNNRAELYAIYQAIKRITNNLKFDIINIYTDSDYSQKSLNVWIKKWKTNNWMNSKGQPVENQDIIKKIDTLRNKYLDKIFIHWIRAHTNKNDIHSINNKKADELANISD
jgi:ribonuclease HI